LTTISKNERGKIARWREKERESARETREKKRVCSVRITTCPRMKEGRSRSHEISHFTGKLGSRERERKVCSLRLTKCSRMREGSGKWEGERKVNKMYNFVSDSHIIQPDIGQHGVMFRTSDEICAQRT
jgi:hypothetical protein